MIVSTKRAAIHVHFKRSSIRGTSFGTRCTDRIERENKLDPSPYSYRTTAVSPTPPIMIDVSTYFGIRSLSLTNQSVSAHRQTVYSRSFHLYSLKLPKSPRKKIHFLRGLAVALSSSLATPQGGGVRRAHWPRPTAQISTGISHELPRVKPRGHNLLLISCGTPHTTDLQLSLIYHKASTR